MTEPATTLSRQAAMQSVATVAELRDRVAAARRDGATVALVPTMGALHDGHLALVAEARRQCGFVIATIFVNEKQFGPAEDFASYPRSESADAALLAEAGADLLFLPSRAEMYPDGFSTAVSVSGLTAGLCGPHRPGHFDGVTTVVAKLLIQAAPDAAFFGEKDYQQLQVIRRLVRDLDLPVRIVGVPTVREPDGLALSSRNRYLTEAERAAAPALFRTLSDMAETLSDGRTECAGEIDKAVKTLTDAGFASVDYVAVCDAETLEPLMVVDRPARILAAARLGKARLIDNVSAGPAAK